MSCCCFSFKKARTTSIDENMLSDFLPPAQERAVAAGLESHCNCRLINRVNPLCGCEFSAPTSAAAMLRSGSHIAGTSSSSTNALPPTAIERTAAARGKASDQSPAKCGSGKFPSASTNSYTTAKSDNDDESVAEIDYTDDSCPANGSQGSIDPVEASNIEITDKKNFYRTVGDTPLNYIDKFGRTQSMRRYSSAINEPNVVGNVQRNIDTDDELDLDTEPLELSTQITEDTQLSESQRPSSTNAQPPTPVPTCEAISLSTTTLHAAADVSNQQSLLPYIGELRERLPQVRANLRHVEPVRLGEPVNLTFSPEQPQSSAPASLGFDGPKDIGLFLVSPQSSANSQPNSTPSPASTQMSTGRGDASSDVPSSFESKAGEANARDTPLSSRRDSY